MPSQATPPLSRMPSPPASKLSQSLHKTVWIWTRSKEIMRAAVEVGWTTFIFTPNTKFMAPQWTSIEWIKPLFLEGGRFLNQEGNQVALLGQVYSGEQLDYFPAMMGRTEIVIINDLDWQVIPPESIIAAFQGRRTLLFATVSTAAGAQVYLEALEVGTNGVVLHTDSCSEIIALRVRILQTLHHTPRLRSQQHSKLRRQPHTTERSFNSSPPTSQPTPSLLLTSIGEFSDRLSSWVFVSGCQSWQPSSKVLRVWRRVFWLFLGFFVGLAKPSPWVAIISYTWSLTSLPRLASRCLLSPIAKEEEE